LTTPERVIPASHADLPPSREPRTDASRPLSFGCASSPLPWLRTHPRASSPTRPLKVLSLAGSAPPGSPSLFVKVGGPCAPGPVRRNKHEAISPQVVLQLASIASLPTTSSSLNSLFRVLCIFRLRYLCSIGLSFIFSLRWSIPPALGCTVKQPDSPTSSSALVAWFLPLPEPLRGCHPLCRLVPKDL